MPRVTIPATGQYGCIADALPQELPINAWSNSMNVRFRDGYSERFPGNAPVFTTPSVAPYFITPYAVPTATYWVHAGLARVFAYDGTTLTEITPAGPFTGAIDDRWSGGSLNGVLVMNNGKEIPHFWNGNTGTDLAALTAWDVNWRCASIRPFKNYLIAMDVTKSGTRYPHMVKWSDAADPGAIPSTWDAADPANDAGEQDLAETPDLLVDGLPMGDVFVVYKERSMYAMQFIGDPYIWRFSRLPGNVGMLARGCVADTPRGHVVLTAGDVVLHNGQGPKSIISGRNRRFLFSQMDATNYKRSFVVANPEKNEVWVCFPEAGEDACTMAMVWNWESDTWAPRSLNNATYGATGQLPAGGGADSWDADLDEWESDTTAWNQAESSQAASRLILTESTPALSLIDTGSTFSGTAVEAMVERTGLAFDDPLAVKVMRSITPRVEAPTGTELIIEVGGSMDAEKAPVYSPPVTYVVGQSYKADVFASGRFLAIRIRSNGAQAPWRINSIDADVVVMGSF